MAIERTAYEKPEFKHAVHSAEISGKDERFVLVSLNTTFMNGNVRLFYVHDYMCLARYFLFYSWLPGQAAGRDTRCREAHASKEGAGGRD